jgi:aerobic C4-dicarboxylate transport protein
VTRRLADGDEDEDDHEDEDGGTPSNWNLGYSLDAVSGVSSRLVTTPRLFRSLYVQVLIAVLIGAVLGHLRPGLGVALRPLGEGFIKLVKMLIAPIIFATVVVGIARMGDLRKLGRIGVKAIVYFEVVTTCALVIGLLVGKLVRPGGGLHVSVASLDSKSIASYVSASKHLGAVDFLLNVIPTTLIDAFAKGDILQVLLVSVLFGAAAAMIGEPAAPVIAFIDAAGHVLFRIVGIIMRLAPLGALGAIAFTVGQFGVGALVGLAKLMATFYLTGALFVLVFLGIIARRCGFGIIAFIRYIREEILIVLATSSSESVLPRMIRKMEALGCRPAVAGVVIPMGYSFNLDGTSIYLTLATLFLSQALDAPLGLGQEIGLLAVLLLTSKGAAAVTGGGFVTLAATLSASSTLPVEGLALLLGVDRFMSEARAIVNLIGNGVATVALSRWENELDQDQLRRTLGAAGTEISASREGRDPQHPGGSDH